MITIVGQRRLYWRNRHSPAPALQTTLALDTAFAWSLVKATAEASRLLAVRWSGPVVADPTTDTAGLVCTLAQQLQQEFETCSDNHAVIVRNPDLRRTTLYFSCRDHVLADAVLRLTVRVVNRLVAHAPQAELETLFAETRTAALGFDQSTRAMVAEVQRRGIPWQRATQVSGHVLVGQGTRQKMLRETLRSGESAIGREIARSKALTFTMLAPLGLPVGRVAAVRDIGAALAAAQQIGYPLVLKPSDGQKGRNVFVGLRNDDDLRRAFTAAAGERQLLLQTFFPGDDHRLLVVDGRLVAAARRLPASVSGDGRSTVAQVVARANRDPRRGPGYSRLMNLIVLDAESDRLLAHAGLTRDSVVPAGAEIRVKATANISTGGTAEDVTAIIHPDNARAAIRAARALGLTVAGIDFISPDITRSWHQTGGGICEVNTVVGLRPHWIANPQQNVVAPILDTIAPAGDDLRIPTAMVTGSKGKSTVTLMLAAILDAAGHVTGVASSDGVTIGGERVASGDHAGANGARLVLRDPTVSAAVLETARGGLLRSGMHLDRCDVAALLNVQSEQVGLDGVETLREMALLKAKILDAAHQAIVINGEDELCREMAGLRPNVKHILFAMDADAVSKHVDDGGDAVVLAGTEIVLRTPKESVVLALAADLPATHGGLLRPNIVNALAAAAIAHGMNVAPDVIARGLVTSDTGFAKAHGRFSIVDGFPMTVMFDRARYPAAFAATLPVLDAMPVKGRRFCVVTMSGDRQDWNYGQNAQLLAGRFQRYICFERPDRRRGKQPGMIADALRDALVAAGTPASAIATAHDYAAAARRIAQDAASDDFVAIFGADFTTCVAELRAAFATPH